MAKGEKRSGVVRPAFNQKSAAVSTGKGREITDRAAQVPQQRRLQAELLHLDRG